MSIDEAAYTEREKLIHLKGYERGAKDAFLKAAKEQSAKTAHCTHQPVELADVIERIQNTMCPTSGLRGGDFYTRIEGRITEDDLHALIKAVGAPKRESGWQPLDTAPKGYDGEKFNHVLFRGVSKARSFSGPVYVSGWMDNDRKPVHEYAYKLIITGWKPLSVIEPEATP